MQSHLWSGTGRAGLVALAALALAPVARTQLNVVEEGFHVDALPSLTQPWSLECSPGGSWGESVYVSEAGTGRIQRIDAQGAVTLFSDGLAFPLGMAFGPGPSGQFGNYLYVGDNVLQGVWQVDDLGAEVPFTGFPRTVAVAFDPSGVYSSDLFLSSDQPPGLIARVDAMGNPTPFTGLGVLSLCLGFGPGGAWGSGMYASEVNTGSVVRISAGGTPTSFAGGFSVPAGFDWAEGLLFRGDLFVTDNDTGEIWRVAPDGTRSLWATLPGASDVAFCNGALYVLSFLGDAYKVTEGPRAFCFGSLDTCPCGNAGLPDRGCDIAQGTGGVRLDAVDYAPDFMGGGTVTFVGQGYPPASTPAFVVFRGTSIAPPFVHLGDGRLCAGVPVTRLAGGLASGGISRYTLTHGNGPNEGPGTFYYQLWFRNNPPTFCNPDLAFNASNGVEVLWP